MKNDSVTKTNILFSMLEAGVTDNFVLQKLRGTIDTTEDSDGLHYFGNCVGCGLLGVSCDSFT